MPTERGPFADKRTTYVMTMAVALLKGSGLTIDRQIADELELRALWIERARYDMGVSEERRLAVAAVEDAPHGPMWYEPPRLTLVGKLNPGDPARVPLLDIAVHGGWHVKLWRRIDTGTPRFDASLTSPDGVEIYANVLAVSLDRSVESIAGQLAQEIPLPAHEIQRELRSLIAVSDRETPRG